MTTSPSPSKSILLYTTLRRTTYSNQNIYEMLNDFFYRRAAIVALLGALFVGRARLLAQCARVHAARQHEHGRRVHGQPHPGRSPAARQRQR